MVTAGSEAWIHVQVQYSRKIHFLIVIVDMAKFMAPNSFSLPLKRGIFGGSFTALNET